VRLEGLGKFEKSNDLTGNRTRDLPVCSIVPEPTTLPRAPKLYIINPKIIQHAYVLSRTFIRGA
jgi:hypothetical protein